MRIAAIIGTVLVAAVFAGCGGGGARAASRPRRFARGSTSTS